MHDVQPEELKTPDENSAMVLLVDDQATQRRIDALVAAHGDDVAPHFLRDVGLGWAADILATFPGHSDQDTSS